MYIDDNVKEIFELAFKQSPSRADYLLTKIALKLNYHSERDEILTLLSYLRSFPKE